MKKLITKFIMLFLFLFFSCNNNAKSVAWERTQLEGIITANGAYYNKDEKIKYVECGFSQPICYVFFNDGTFISISADNIISKHYSYKKVKNE